jgi:hypothetical protein
VEVRGTVPVFPCSGHAHPIQPDIPDVGGRSLTEAVPFYSARAAKQVARGAGAVAKRVVSLSCLPSGDEEFHGRRILYSPHYRSRRCSRLSHVRGPRHRVIPFSSRISGGSGGAPPLVFPRGCGAPTCPLGFSLLPPTLVLGSCFDSKCRRLLERLLWHGQALRGSRLEAGVVLVVRIRNTAQLQG